MLEKGSKSIEGSYIKHPINNINSLSIRRTDKGRIYSYIPIKDRSLRAKCMASKHLYFKYYTTLHIRIAYTVNAPYITFLQPLYSKRLVFC